MEGIVYDRVRDRPLLVSLFPSLVGDLDRVTERLSLDGPAVVVVVVVHVVECLANVPLPERRLRGPSSLDDDARAVARRAVEGSAAE